MFTLFYSTTVQQHTVFKRDESAGFNLRLKEKKTKQQTHPNMWSPFFQTRHLRCCRRPGLKSNSSLGLETASIRQLKKNMKNVRSLLLDALLALSLGAGLLHLGDGLRCFAGEDQRSSRLLDHHVVLNPDAHAAETLWRLVIVLADVQACDKMEKQEGGIKQRLDVDWFFFLSNLFFCW